MLYAQEEYVTGIQLNGNLPSKEFKSASLKATVGSKLLPLPFIDDFSSEVGYADKNKWQSSSVFISNSFVDTFMSPGIAVFDALDNNNVLYTEYFQNIISDITDTVFVADSLVSHYYDLTYDTTYYLSFYYLPGGLGHVPEEDDSLVVSFYFRDSARYEYVWSARGFDTTEFQQVIIEIPEIYHTDSFVFKIYNYASLEQDQGFDETLSNKDYWLVDYVTLRADTLESNLEKIKDATYVRKLNGLLKTDANGNFAYSQIPYNHFVVNLHLKLRDTCYIENYYEDEAFIPIKFKYEINSIDGNFKLESGNLGEVDYPSKEVSKIPYRFSVSDFLNMPLDKPISLSFKAILSEIDKEENITSNDTLEHIQEFNDYYAYDDGSSEKSYGFRGVSVANSIFAHKFTNYKFGGDSLKYISIYFNPTFDSMSINTPLRIAVFMANGEGGIPGTVLYEELVQIENFGFQKFNLKTPVFVDEDFYVGWIQEPNVFPTERNYLNVGYDVNTPNYGRSYVFTDGSWGKSNFPNMVMIRAGFGDDIPTSIKQVIVNNNNIYPNPGNGNFYVKDLINYPYTLSVYDISGKQVHTEVIYSNYIKITHLDRGVYIVKLVNEHQTLVSVQKLIIQK